MEKRCRREREGRIDSTRGCTQVYTRAAVWKGEEGVGARGGGGGEPVGEEVNTRR